MALGSDTYLKLTFLEASPKEEEKPKSDTKRILPYADSEIYYTTLCKARRLTRGEDVKSVYDIALDMKNIERDFQPGDTIAILPKNDETEVEQLLDRLNLLDVAHKSYTLEILNEATTKTSIPNHIPPSSTLYELFLKHLNIRFIPKKIFLRMLMKYTKCEAESNKLLHLTSVEGAQDYLIFIDTHVSLLAVLLTFPSCLPPIEKLLETLPPLQPRIYSISSSPFLKSELHITFSVIEKKNYGTKGICTGWLEDAIKQFQSQENNLEIIPFYFRKTNKFRLPANVSLPILMIGPGTGIAPFFGFLQHREIQAKRHNIKFGESWLFFGCRYPDGDFLYETEIEQLLQDGILTRLFICYSRQGSDKRRYIQEVLKENAKEIADQITTQNAIVYVCGDAKGMMVDVNESLAWCLETTQNMSASEAEKYIKQLEKSDRYIRDIWL